MSGNAVRKEIEAASQSQADTSRFSVKKRSGQVSSFDSSLIWSAIAKAFMAQSVELQDGRDYKAGDKDIPAETNAEIQRITQSVLKTISSEAQSPQGVTVEKIQDVVEMQLMQAGHYNVAKSYILYRAEHSKRAREASRLGRPRTPTKKGSRWPTIRA